jgi:hypothetical protein
MRAAGGSARPAPASQQSALWRRCNAHGRLDEACGRGSRRNLVAQEIAGAVPIVYLDEDPVAGLVADRLS